MACAAGGLRGVTNDIVGSYRRPKAIFGTLIGRGRREDMVLSFALLAGGLLFIAMMPFHAREAHLHPEVPLAARLYWSGLFLVFLLPLIFYLLSFVAGFGLRLVRARVTGYALRLVLFWSVLALTPISLLFGMVAGFIGPGPALQLVAALWVAAFIWIAQAGLRHAAWGQQNEL